MQYDTSVHTSYTRTCDDGAADMLGCDEIDGVSDGMLVGQCDTLGLKEGPVEGWADGVALGCADGASLGLELGGAEGASEGVEDG